MASLQAAAPPGMRAATGAASWSSTSSPCSSSCASSASSLQGRKLALVLVVSGGSGRGRRCREGVQRLQVRALEELPFLKNLGTLKILGLRNNASQTKSSQTKSSKTKSSQTKSSQTKSSQTKSSQTKSSSSKSLERGNGRSPQSAEEEESEDFSLDSLLKKISSSKSTATPPPPPPASRGTIILRESLPVGPLEFNFPRIRRTDSRTVFVAGALGQIGARTTQRLLKSGFVVRAGVPDIKVAQQLAEFATQYGILSSDEAKRLTAVEFDYKNTESVAKALANAGKVLVTVGPSEDGYNGEVTTDDALRVVEAAALGNVGHFILVTEPTSARPQQEANLFSALASLFKPKKKKLPVKELINKLAETDLKYTVIKASAAQVDESSEGNIDILAEGTPKAAFTKVGKQQVATVINSAFSNSTVSENKVVEVILSPSAEERAIDDLFGSIPRDNRRQAISEAIARAQAEEKEREERLQAESDAQLAAEAAREAAEKAARLEAEARKLAQEEAKAAAAAAIAQAKAAEAAASLEEATGKVKELGGTVAGSPKEAGSAKKDFPFLKASGKEGAPQESKGMLQMFGSFFKQETIYVDE